MFGERIGSGESGPVRMPGRPVAALHVNDPSLRQSQGDVIRGTVQEAGLPRGAEPTAGSTHVPYAFTFSASQPNLGENRQEQRGASGFLIV